jgi:hypothetical protein
MIFFSDKQLLLMKSTTQNSISVMKAVVVLPPFYFLSWLRLLKFNTIKEIISVLEDVNSHSRISTKFISHNPGPKVNNIKNEFYNRAMLFQLFESGE